MTSSEYRRFTEVQLVGRRARTTRELETWAGKIPKGRVVTITGKWGGLRIRSARLKITMWCKPQSIELL